MKLQKSLIVFLFLAGAFLAKGEEISFTLTHGKEIRTNLVLEVAAGETCELSLPLGNLKPVYYSFVPGKPAFAKGHTYKALCVGVNEYAEGALIPLTSCVADAQSMREEILARGAFDLADILLLTNAAATKAEIRANLKSAAETLKAGDAFVYSQSSHGGRDFALQTYVCAYDEDFSASELAEDLEAFKDGVKVTVILDTCYSGGMIPPEEVIAKIQSEMRRVRARKRGLTLAEAERSIKNDVLFLASCRKDELTYESDAHGIFTEALIYAVNGFAKDLDGDFLLSFEELFAGALAYLEAQQIEEQHPVMSGSAPEKFYYGQAFSLENRSTFFFWEGVFTLRLDNVVGDGAIAVELFGADSLNLTISSFKLKDLPGGTSCKGLVAYSVRRDLSGDNLLPEKLPAALSLGKLCFEIGTRQKISANKKTAVYVYDDGVQKSKTKIKVDYKNALMFYKFNGTLTPGLNKIFTEVTPKRNGTFLFREGLGLLTTEKNLQVKKNKNGFTAKVIAS